MRIYFVWIINIESIFLEIKKKIILKNDKKQLGIDLHKNSATMTITMGLFLEVFCVLAQVDHKKRNYLLKQKFED